MSSCSHNPWCHLCWPANCDSSETTGLLHLLITRAKPRQAPSSPAERAVALLPEHTTEPIAIDSHAQRAGLTTAEL